MVSRSRLGDSFSTRLGVFATRSAFLICEHAIEHALRELVVELELLCHLVEALKRRIHLLSALAEALAPRGETTPHHLVELATRALERRTNEKVRQPHLLLRGSLLLERVCRWLQALSVGCLLRVR